MGSAVSAALSKRQMSVAFIVHTFGRKSPDGLGQRARDLKVTTREFSFFVAFNLA
jgi:hypothetical protein